MVFFKSHMLEMVIGILLFGAALFYLTAQTVAVDQLTKKVRDMALENNELYQQYNDTNINYVSDEELYAIMMGYREYPIVIDGVIMNTDVENYEEYISLIKDGNYRKSYQCDSENEITQIIFTSAGVM